MQTTNVSTSSRDITSLTAGHRNDITSSSSSRMTPSDGEIIQFIRQEFIRGGRKEPYPPGQSERAIGLLVFVGMLAAAVVHFFPEDSKWRIAGLVGVGLFVLKGVLMIRKRFDDKTAAEVTEATTIAANPDAKKAVSEAIIAKGRVAELDKCARQNNTAVNRAMEAIESAVTSVNQAMHSKDLSALAEANRNLSAQIHNAQQAESTASRSQEEAHRAIALANAAIIDAKAEVDHAKSEASRAKAKGDAAKMRQQAGIALNREETLTTYSPAVTTYSDDSSSSSPIQHYFEDADELPMPSDDNGTSNANQHLRRQYRDNDSNRSQQGEHKRRS